MSTPQNTATTTLPVDDCPIEIRALLDALGKKVFVTQDRRSRERSPYRTRAKVWLSINRDGPNGVEIWIRDHADRVVSFVTRACLPVGNSVELELTLHDGKTRRFRATVGRCRQFRENWFEGMLKVAK